MKGSILDVLQVAFIILIIVFIIVMAVIIVIQGIKIKKYEAESEIFLGEKQSITCIYKKTYASTVNYVLRDDNTGVCYIAMSNGAITPMVDANGNIIVDKKFIKSDAE